jgi:5-formyltetrahydrofolate cyclo-ligase
MTKKELRNIYKEKRNAIHSKERLKMDDLLLLQFQQLNLNEVQFLFTYWPLQQMNEPNTLLFTHYLRHTIPDLQIAYPVIDYETSTMKAILINEETIYQPNAYNILEPTKGEELSPNDIDLVFVPLLICDENGYRVGYGKGFYDRYLSNCREDVLKIGFSYFDPVDKIDDINEFDIPLDCCITSDEIYEF